jgi:hypothetical protein
MIEKGYFAKGEAWVAGEETTPDPQEDETVVFEDFLLVVYGCLRTLCWLMFC